MAEAQLFKDYYTVYYSIIETCFNSCIDISNNRTLEPHEAKCIDMCTQKVIKLNHRFMATYIKYEQIRKQREKEAEAIQASVNLSNENKLVESVNVE